MIHEFYRPRTIEEAINLKQKIKNAVWMAGGTWLNSRPASDETFTVISLSDLALDTVTVTPSAINVGACITLQAMCDTMDIPSPLRLAALQITNRNIRNMATLGGAVAAAEPYSNIIPVLLAFEASLKLADRNGIKSVLLEDYLKNRRKKLIVSVEIPCPCGKVIQRVFRRMENDRPVIVAAVGAMRDKDSVKRAVVALGGISQAMYRLRSVEKLMTRNTSFGDPEIESTIKRDKKLIWKSDMYGTADFKRQIAGTIIASAIREALGE